MPNAPPPPYCILEVSQHGLKMVDKRKHEQLVEGNTAAERLKFKLEKMFGKQKVGNLFNVV